MTAKGEGPPVRVLIVEDEPDVARILKKIIQTNGSYAVDVITERFNVRERFATAPPDVLFLDLVMPEMDGFEVIAAVREVNRSIPIVVVSAHSTVENAVKAVKLGAFDFLPKPFDPESVELMLAKLEREFVLVAQASRAREQDPYLQAIRGETTQIRAVREWILKVRPAQANVLIQGESGTGKELVARAIHGGRGPFVAVNMAAIPSDLAESELFGHRPGAFTGATRERQGLIAEAHGGTLFLDEVDAMPAPVQAKLLRALEDRRVRPLGGNQQVAVDFRLISATNADLEDAVQRGTFRRDLYHRLRVLSVTLPPLRERLTDIPILVDDFVQRYARAHGCRARRLAPGALDQLMRRPWPGNVRELENVIEEAVLLCPEDADEIDLPSFPVSLPAESVVADGRIDKTDLKPLEEVERDYVARVLSSTGGNKAKAARILRIDYKTLLRKLAEPA